MKKAVMLICLLAVTGVAHGADDGPPQHHDVAGTVFTDPKGNVVGTLRALWHGLTVVVTEVMFAMAPEGSKELLAAARRGDGSEARLLIDRRNDAAAWREMVRAFLHAMQADMLSDGGGVAAKLEPVLMTEVRENHDPTMRQALGEELLAVSEDGSPRAQMAQRLLAAMVPAEAK